MNIHKILMVDDESQMRRVLRASLVARGYQVVEAQSGDEALHKLKTEACDFILLDLNLPGPDGIDLCRRIRAHSNVPIIVVSVRSSEGDKVLALQAGADDYVSKPFGIQELLARIEAVSRRNPAEAPAPEVLVLDTVLINLETHSVAAPHRQDHLTPKEYELLRYLVAHAGQIIPHRRLLQAVWGPDYGDEVEYLRVFINQLRKKIEQNPHRPRFLLTEPWVGYRFAPPARNGGRMA